MTSSSQLNSLDNLNSVDGSKILSEKAKNRRSELVEAVSAAFHELIRWFDQPIRLDNDSGNNQELNNKKIVDEAINSMNSLIFSLNAEYRNDDDREDVKQNFSWQDFAKILTSEATRFAANNIGPVVVALRYMIDEIAKSIPYFSTSSSSSLIDDEVGRTITKKITIIFKSKTMKFKNRQKICVAINYFRNPNDAKIAQKFVKKVMPMLIKHFSIVTEVCATQIIHFYLEIFEQIYANYKKYFIDSNDADDIRKVLFDAAQLAKLREGTEKITKFPIFFNEIYEENSARQEYKLVVLAHRLLNAFTYNAKFFSKSIPNEKWKLHSYYNRGGKLHLGYDLLSAKFCTKNSDENFYVSNQMYVCFKKMDFRNNYANIRFYFEVTALTDLSDQFRAGWGIHLHDLSFPSYGFIGFDGTRPMIIPDNKSLYVRSSFDEIFLNACNDTDEPLRSDRIMLHGGDTIGCMIDLDRQEFAFSLNGDDLLCVRSFDATLGKHFEQFQRSRFGFTPTARLAANDHVYFNFGQNAFRRQFAPSVKIYKLIFDKNVDPESHQHLFPIP